MDFSACFSSVKSHNVSGPHLLPSFTTCQKNPFDTPRTVLKRAKISICNGSQFSNVTPVAGPIFETKIESFFLESFFLERNYCPRTDFSGGNACSILSHPVISWNESRADPCPLERIHYCQNVFSSWKRRNTPDFERFFLEKRPWKRFCTNILIRGKWIHSTDIDGNQVLGRNAVPQIPLQKKALQKKALDFCLENWSCVRRYSCHTDLSRFVLPISDPSELNFSQFVGFQDSPNLSKIEKVAETCEFDGKEPLFVERTIAISIRVLGWTWLFFSSLL